MTELIEEQESTQPDFERYLDVVRRRHMYFLVLMFLGWLLIWGSSWILPARYKSSTLILVEQPTMPENYVAPNVTDNLQDRLQSITQQILSRTRLLMIIEKLNLYSGADSAKNQDDKIEQMRKDIGIDLVRDTSNNEITSFRVSFSSPIPFWRRGSRTNLRTCSSTKISRFVRSNPKAQRILSKGNSKMRAQLSPLRKKESSSSKRRTKERCRAQQSSNLQILSGLQGQLQNQQNSLNTAKQQGFISSR